MGATCLPLYSRRDDPEVADRMRRITWNRDVIEHFRHVLAGRFIPWDGLDRVTCPTLVLAGEYDPVATASAARRFVSALTATEASPHVLPDAGHGAFREAPEASTALLRDFVTGRLAYST